LLAARRCVTHARHCAESARAVAFAVVIHCTWRAWLQKGRFSAFIVLVVGVVIFVDIVTFAVVVVV
jgi:hypothetical protein